MKWLSLGAKALLRINVMLSLDTTLLCWNRYDIEEDYWKDKVMWSQPNVIEDDSQTRSEVSLTPASKSAYIHECVAECQQAFIVGLVLSHLVMSLLFLSVQNEFPPKMHTLLNAYIIKILEPGYIKTILQILPWNYETMQNG